MCDPPIPGCAVVLVLAGIAGLVTIAQSQDDPGLLLARTCVHEAGFDSPADCQLVHAVLSGIVERDGVSYRQAWRLASPRLARCDVRRSWVCRLRADGERPAGFPARWSRYRDRWMAVLEVSRRLIAGEQVAAVCAERPRVWGSRSDVARGRARGRRWVDAGCVGARNLGGRWL